MRTASYAIHHKKTETHRASVAYENAADFEIPMEEHTWLDDCPNPLEEPFVHDAVCTLLNSLAGNPSPPSSGSDHGLDSPMSGFNWRLYEALGDTELTLSPEQEATAVISQELLARFDDVGELGSDDEDVEHSDDELAQDISKPRVHGTSTSSLLIMSFF
jgi:hypothetical protein